MKKNEQRSSHTDAASCVFCGEPAEGNYSIHRDGFGVGPDVPLCDGCGSQPMPTEQMIWRRIRENRHAAGERICVRCGASPVDTFGGYCIDCDVQEPDDEAHP